MQKNTVTDTVIYAVQKEENTVTPAVIAVTVQDNRVSDR